MYHPADSGKTPVIAGKPDESELLRRIVSTDQGERMPPPEFGKPLEKQEVELIRQWIAAGAPPLKHWSFVPPVLSSPPTPDLARVDAKTQPIAQNWLHNAIDRFVLARQLEHGLAPSPTAARDVLLRRLSLDLVGLPPDAEMVQSFCADERPDALERVVDRLLASPAYGEHWARKWLDLARYADSAGYADDPPRTIWGYRDWVIRAINADMPMDEFSIAQIAGDLLPNPTEDDLVATAFHRNTLTNNEGGTNDEEFRNVAIVDRVNTTMAVWMGLTFSCAQCHTHKYDPLTQDEYFKVFDIFNQSQDADRRDETPVVELFTSEQLQQRKQYQARIEQLHQQIKTISPEVQSQYDAWSGQLKLPQWQTLKPTSFGAKTNTEADWNEQGLVRVNKQAQNKIVADTYTLEVQPAAGTSQVRAIGIRTVPLKDLPGGGAGFGGGNFVLTDVRVSIVPPQAQALRARYVRFDLPGNERILSLAEVQVFAGGSTLPRVARPRRAARIMVAKQFAQSMAKRPAITPRTQ